MDILMIGHSRSGKTSYMAGLYKLYGDAPNGFGLWLRILTRAFIQKEPTSHLNIIFGCNITIHYLFRLIGTTIEVVLYWNQQKILKMLNCWLTELIMQMLLLSF